ncbi:MAG: hypothetical protein CBD97_01945 [Pelagibacteraceae bacterium TMED237]|nr:MAG: hypothetical protein CBD97_01945 [Pelagibacteraceae bacterium TMED237]|tara:strand:- start:4112 stop:4663 length:552 start_codon:yes stop_codon:yes gene_type:complete
MINNNLALYKNGETEESQKQLWTKELENAVNKQIELELTNFATYQELSNYFSNAERGLYGIAKFFEKESDEELKHSREFMNYQIKRGGSVGSINSMPIDISELENASNKIITAYQIALAQEKFTYLALLELHEISCNDPAFQDFIEEFLKEQVETQYKLNNIIKLLQLGGSVYCAIHEENLRE